MYIFFMKNAIQLLKLTTTLQTEPKNTQALVIYFIIIYAYHFTWIGLRLLQLLPLFLPFIIVRSENEINCKEQQNRKNNVQKNTYLFSLDEQKIEMSARAPVQTQRFMNVFKSSKAVFFF